ncbi:hypothetical protein MKX03_020566 [Papaver bracteatum]|nr:hypothetical protein MKX03_020566 [Papaver bracteatum]
MAATERKRLPSSSYQPVGPVLTSKKDNKADEFLDEIKKNYEDLPEHPFRAICIKAAELEAYSRHPNSDRNEDKVQENVHRSVEEEIRKQDQARIAPIFARKTVQRLLGDEKTGIKGLLESWMKMDKRPEVIKLASVTIFPRVDGQGGDSVVGTLEAHVDRFIYTTSSPHIHSQFTFQNVKAAFFQVEDEKKRLPLLYFQLHHPIKVGTENKKDIQCRLAPTAVGKRRPENDSDKFEKEKQTRGRDRNEDLKNFVEEFHGVYKEEEFHRVYTEEFHGVLPSKAAAVFFLTFTMLVQLANSPFFVVKLQDVEIVNLARLGPDEIDMTVVFKDFNCPVLQISSIPLDSLSGIKRCLDFWGVKFYENDRDLNWNPLVKKIADSPESFIQEGGWNAYKLEDNTTSLYYRHYYLEASQVVDDVKLALID